MTFLVACLLRPRVQKRARDEIDAAVGRDRLPTFEDRPKLPFVDAMCKEVLRWRPVTPLGASDQCCHKRVAKVLTRFIAVPHSALKDGVYDGFFIPKGKLVLFTQFAVN